MKCNLCNSKNYKKRIGTVRDNKNLEIYECCDCGLVFLSENNHIDENFYINSNMHQLFDFYKWRNETLADDTRRYEFLKSSLVNKKVLDFGSGNGGFLKLTKNIYKEVLGVELEKAVIPYYKEENIPLENNLDDISEKFDIITSFHVIEHIQRYHLSNHLYWLSKNRQGHEKWGNFFDSNELTKAYENQLASLGVTDTIIACLKKGSK